MVLRTTWSMRVLKRTGLRLDPWGVPRANLAGADMCPASRTEAILSVRKSLIQLRSLPLMPFWVRACSMYRGSALSKAFSRSRRTATALPWEEPLVRSVMAATSWHIASVVDLPLVYPCRFGWRGGRDHFNLDNIMRSIILEVQLRREMGLYVSGFPALGIGTIRAFFQVVGSMAWEYERLIRCSSRWCHSWGACRMKE